MEDATIIETNNTHQPEYKECPECGTLNPVTGKCYNCSVCGYGECGL
jgi:hypothetical protein